MRFLHVVLTPVRRAEDFLFRITPRIAITDTFQVGFAVAFFAVGLISMLALLTGQPAGSIEKALSTDVLRAMWGGSLLVGGVAQIIGLQVGSRDAERFGMKLTMVGCLVYALALLGYASTSAGVVLGVAFLVFFACYWVRVRSSSRARRFRT